MEDRIVYEDEHILVINKPHGQPTQSSEKTGLIDLYSELNSFLEQREGAPVYLALHHRLDAATAVLILFCKNRNLNRVITTLFREKLIHKVYECLVDIQEPIQF